MDFKLVILHRIHTPLKRNITELSIQQKGLTDEGKAELMTKADLVSNKLILDVLKRFMGLKVRELRIIFNITIYHLDCIRGT